MMPVPSYQLIPFLEWIHRRGIRISVERMASEQLRELALEFLRSGPHQPFETIVGLMSVFQTCPMVREPTAETQMEHFAGCGQCLEMIRERRLGDRHLDGQWSLRPELHPLLAGFVEWARHSPLEDSVERAARRLDGRLFDAPDPAFRRFIHDVGHDLREEFNRYLRMEREHHPEVVESFEEWRRSHDRDELGRRVRRRRSDENTHPLNANDSPEQAAFRLAESVRIAIEHGFYDDQIAEEPQFARLMSLAMESPENLGQALEFMNWLRRQEPDLALPGTIPSSELEGLALRFCEDRGYSNARSFATEARKWLSGTGSERILSRIARFLGLDRRGRMPDGTRNPHNPLDRYGTVRFHGMFLFLSSGDFPGFLEAHWRDIHHLTGDHLDIYFSQSDLRDRTSGYEVSSELRSVEIRVDALPALLLWEDELEVAVTVPLQGLDHENVVEVVKAVVQAVRDDAALADAANQGTQRSLELRGTGDHDIVVQMGASLIINNGGVVGNTYKNVGGVVGAMGDNAVAHDNVFLQDARKLLSEVTLTAEHGTVVEQLANALAAAKFEQLKPTERMEGATQLAAIAEAAIAGQPPEEPLAGWRKWLKGLGDRAQPVLTVLANVTTIATPIAKLLGLPL